MKNPTKSCFYIFINKMEIISFEDNGKLIRLADSIEACGANQWLSASGTIPKSQFTPEQCLNNLKKNYKSILVDFPSLRLKLIKKENLYYWAYTTNEEIKFENVINIVDLTLIDDVPESFPLDIGPLWRVHFSQIGDKIKIKVIASHSLVYGRSIFLLLDLFSSYALNKEFPEKLKMLKNQPILYRFGKSDWFTKEVTDKKDYEPFVEFKIKTIDLFPSFELPSHLVNIQWDVPYLPISKFCRKHDISPQAFLMAIQNTAIRIYHKGKLDDTPIGVHIPVDNKYTKYASELFKKSLFFLHAGFVVTFMENEKDMLENMKKCYKSLKESLNTSISCDITYFLSNFFDENGKFIPPKTFFDGESISFASHIGLVGEGFEDVQFRFYQPIENNKYKALFYGFHNQETFSFMLLAPFNYSDDYLKILKEVSLKYYDFMAKDVSE